MGVHGEDRVQIVLQPRRRHTERPTLALLRCSSDPFCSGSTHERDRLEFGETRDETGSVLLSPRHPPGRGCGSRRLELTRLESSSAHDTFPLDRATDALHALATEHIRGKLAISAG